MPVGPGKYNEQLEAALKDIGKECGILIILDPKDPSFCCRLTHAIQLQVPRLLRDMADMIEMDLRTQGFRPIR